MNGFEADVDQLTARAREFPGLASRADAIHRELSDTLSSIGACWGGDSVGQSFAAAHVAPADSTLGSLGALPSQLDGVGTKLAGTGAAYRDLDTSDAARLRAADEG
jgi:uncharacterized protein YukE